MKDTIPVSVIIPNYNNSEYLEECIASVVGQTVYPAEIIIVDDASSDDSVALVKAMKDDLPFLKIVELSDNRGVSHARNTGARKAVSPFVTFLDSDDFYLGKDKLKKEYELIEENPNAIAYSPIVVVDDQGKRLWGQLDKGKRRFLQGKIGLPLIAGFKCGRPPRDYIVSRNILLGCGGFDESLYLYEDYDLLIRLGLNHEFTCTFSEGTAYRQVAGGLSDRSHDDLANAKESICEKYRQGLPLALLGKVRMLSLLQGSYDWAKRVARGLRP